MKWLTALFVLILILIVIAADLGLGPAIFPLIYLLPWGDKAGHFILMGLLSLLINSVLSAAKVRVFSFNLLKGTIIILAIVTLEELSQLLLIYRRFSFVDLLFDYLGIILFGFLADYLVNRPDYPKILDNSD